MRFDRLGAICVINYKMYIGRFLPDKTTKNAENRDFTGFIAIVWIDF